MPKRLFEKRFLEGNKFSLLDIEICRKSLPYTTKQESLRVMNNNRLSNVNKQKKLYEIVEAHNWQMRQLAQEEREVKERYERVALSLKLEGEEDSERWETVKKRMELAANHFDKLLQSSLRHGNESLVEKAATLMKTIVKVDEARLTYKGYDEAAEYGKLSFEALDELQHLDSTGKLEEEAKKAKIDVKRLRTLLNKLVREEEETPIYVKLRGEFLKKEARDMKKINLRTQQLAKRNKWSKKKLTDEIEVQSRRKAALDKLDKMKEKLRKEQKKQIDKFLLSARIPDTPRSPFPDKSAEDK